MLKVKGLNKLKILIIIITGINLFFFFSLAELGHTGVTIAV